MSTSNVENLAPNVIRRVTKELIELVTQPLEGIKVILNDEDISDIQAIIEGPAETPYHNGYFKVKLVLGKTFPISPPKGFFLTKIFHPNVSRTGEICVNTLKKDWNEDLGIKHILLVIKCLLIVPNPESALNEDAAKLLLEHYEEYCKRAKMITEIHAKPTSEIKCEPNVEDYSHSSNSHSFRRHPENEPSGPLSKKQANNVNNVKTLTTKKPAKNNRRHVLKRL